MKIFLRILASFATLILVFGILLGIVFIKPELILNSRSVNYVKNEYLADTLNWEDIALSVTNEGWSKKISLSANNFQFSWKGGSIKAQQVEGELSVSLHPQSFGIQVIGPLVIKKLSGSAALSEDESKEPFSWDVLRQDLSFLEKIVVEPISVTVAEFTLIQDSKKQRFKGNIDFSGLNKNQQDKLEIKMAELDTADIRTLSGFIEIKDYESIFDPKATIDGRFNGQILSQKIALNFNAHSTNSQTQKIHLKSQIQSHERSLELEINSRRQSQNLAGLITLTSKGVDSKYGDLQLSPCNFNSSWSLSRKTFSLSLSCDGQGYRKSDRTTLLGAFFPESVKFKLASKIELPESKDELLIDSQLKLDTIDTGVIVVTGTAKVLGAINLDMPNLKTLDISTNIAAKVPDFQNLSEQLINTPWAIPAPLNALDGQINCDIKGGYKPELSVNPIPINCHIGLNAAEHKLTVDNVGELQIKNIDDELSFLLDFDITIDELELVLPYIQPGKSMPALALDKRIILDQAEDKHKQGIGEKSTETVPFQYTIRIKTESSNSIRIFSNLIEKPLPIGANMVLSSKDGMTGDITISNHELEVLRRKATIQSLKVSFDKAEKSPVIDGTVKLENNDYKIKMSIYGNLNEPRYSFQSDPPLEEKDIMALVLFGKTPDLLESDKMESVGDAQAAIADGAIGLISMYYLTATPIESVGYSPQSGLFSAKINVQDGFSLALGTDGEEKREIELRKRLGNGWILDTTFVKDGESDITKTVAMLKWGRRY